MIFHKLSSTEHTHLIRDVTMLTNYFFLLCFSFIVCESEVTDTKGVIRSYNSSSTNKYISHTNCRWIFRQQGGIFLVKFNKFNLESSTGCTKDYVMIQDGTEATSPVIGRFCGDSLPRQLNTTTGEMLLTFVTDGKNNFPGFEMSYERFIEGI